jgi:TATA-binding protein-associated factor
MLILPYLVLLVGPCLGRLHDLDAKVRLLANQAFGLMMVYLPLESKLYKKSNEQQQQHEEEEKDPFLSKQLIAERKLKRQFIVQLLDPSKIETFHLQVRINAELRSYQQDGINWLYFLNQYKLHGVLCDDMGLGKTLQTICIMTSDHYLNRQKFRIPSLVICPNSVTGHWKHEIEKYTHPDTASVVDGYFPMRPLLYMGSSVVRNQLRKSFSTYDVIVTSYETVRSDIDYLASIHFNYCVLDEGHIIKNPTTKITLAVKSLRSNHRLILSGTPVNNNVLELWSLFDFLMPGFLGTEKEFDQKYSKHIQAMKGVKMKSTKQKVSASDSKRIVEKGSLALEQLHKQVLPFLLRRLKEQVLNDLPPKIIQDYYCEMSPVQSIIYKEFLKEEAQSLTKDTSDDAKKKSSHIFGALVYLRKLCNHPALVYDDCAEDIQQMIDRELTSSSSQIDDLKHGPKLLALQELLIECGIKPPASENDLDYSAGRHRILIFCQMKTMLDMIELLLFKKHMPHVTYLRMDGSTPSQKRQEICVNFNSDPTIDVLLLTTQVGKFPMY